MSNNSSKEEVAVAALQMMKDEQHKCRRQMVRFNDIIGDNHLLAMVFRFVPFRALITRLTLVCRRWHSIIWDRHTMGNALLWRTVRFHARDLHDRDFSRCLNDLGENLVNLELRFNSKISPETKDHLLDVCGPHLRQLFIVGHMTSELFVHRLLVECRSLRRLSLEPQFLDGDKKQSMKFFRFHMDEYVEMMQQRWYDHIREENAMAIDIGEESVNSDTGEVNREHAEDVDDDDDDARTRDIFSDTYTDTSFHRGNLVAAERVVKALECGFRLPHLLIFEITVTIQLNREYIKKLVGYIGKHAVNLRKMSLQIPDASCLDELHHCTSRRISNLYINFLNSDARINRDSILFSTIERMLATGLHVLSIVGAPVVPIDVLARLVKAGSNSLAFFQVELQDSTTETEQRLIESGLDDPDFINGRIHMKRVKSFSIIGQVSNELPAELFTPLLKTLMRSPNLEKSGRRRFRISDVRLQRLANSLTTTHG